MLGFTSILKNKIMIIIWHVTSRKRKTPKIKICKQERQDKRNFTQKQVKQAKETEKVNRNILIF